MGIEAPEGSADDAVEEEQIAELLFGAASFSAQPHVVQIEHDGAQLTVMQTWSHSSGQLRFYTKCANGEHIRCFKYSQRNLFDTDARCAAHLLAWTAAGLLFDDREEHKAFVPSESDVNEFARGLP